MKNVLTVISKAKYERVKALYAVEVRCYLPSWLRARFGITDTEIGKLLFRDSYVFVHVKRNTGEDLYVRTTLDDRFVLTVPKCTETRLGLDWDVVIEEMKIHELTDYHQTDHYKAQHEKYCHKTVDEVV